MAKNTCSNLELPNKLLEGIATFGSDSVLDAVRSRGKYNADCFTETLLLTFALGLAEILDENDELSKFRQDFLFPKVNTAPKFAVKSHGEETIYLCGNSLGLQPKRTREYVQEELDKWAECGVEGHFTKVCFYSFIVLRLSCR